MSTLEKFGILVILILVVIIGVVAVWGVGGNEGANPFDTSEVAAGVTPASPSGALPDWPAGGAGPAPAAKETGASAPVANSAVPPPAVASPVTPATGVDPAPLADAPAGNTTVYKVKKGDTGSRIARETMGDGTKWSLIATANPGIDARRLKIGQEIRIPSAGAVAKAPVTVRPPMPSGFQAPNPDDGPTGTLPADGTSVVETAAPAGEREVVVLEGDTFSKIAERELGDRNLYMRLVKANPGVDPKRLRPGMRVKLPAAE